MARKYKGGGNSPRARDPQTMGKQKGRRAYRSPDMEGASFRSARGRKSRGEYSSSDAEVRGTSRKLVRERDIKLQRGGNPPR